MFKKLKSKKGFTLIELIIVMTIIAILVLLAAPSFINHVEEAKLTRIKNDTKVAENMMMAKMANDELDFNTLSATDKKEGLNKASKDMNDTEALKGKTYDITNLVNSKLSGRFILNEEGEVVYYDDNKSNKPNGPNKPNKPNKPEIPVNTEWLADEDEDFEFIKINTEYAYEVDGKGKGYFKYTGNNKIVEIPDTIQGHEMTSYYKMFQDTNVEKVISSNPNVDDMHWMFAYSQATKLDLSSFDTSNVKDMSCMFMSSKATTVDLSSFDTSNVTDMNNMFTSSQARTIVFGDNFNTEKVTNMANMFDNIKATKLDLSFFNTSKVTTMWGMFQDSNIEILDLSSFDTKNVEYMNNMFKNSKVTTGYARTQEDADRFNKTSNKPDGLTFEVKSK